MRSLVIGFWLFCGALGLVIGVVLFMALSPRLVLIGYMAIGLAGLVCVCAAVFAVVFTYVSVAKLVGRRRDPYYIPSRKA